MVSKPSSNHKALILKGGVRQGDVGRLAVMEGVLLRGSGYLATGYM